MRITNIHVKWNSNQIMTAAEGQLNGSDLTIDHPAWTLADGTVRTWASGLVKVPDLEVTGTQQITVTLGTKAQANAPVARTADFKKTMKVKSYTGPNAKCVLKA
jgi:hypothetical protein